MTTVVEVRSNSRYSGRISCDTEIGSPVAAKRAGQQFFVCRIHEGKEQADGDGIRSAANDCAHDSCDFGARWRQQDAAIGIQPFPQSKTPRLRNERLGFFKQQIVKLRARLPPNFEDVFEARGRHEGDAPAFSLKKSVRADGGAADQFEAGIDPRATCRDLVQRMSNRIGWFAAAWKEPSEFQGVRREDKHNR